jgi:hypothetical protein
MNVKRTMNINGPHRVAVGIAVAAALLVVWMHGAVATEDDSPGLMFLGCSSSESLAP